LRLLFEVTVYAGFPDGIVLTIEDDGVGIAEVDLPRVFEAFFTTRSTVGTGIGLFVARQFIEGHGGRIEIESSQNGDDHGTTVRVFLPISTTYDSSGEGVLHQGLSGQRNAEDRPASA
jgi:signal transduction histidine kinase